MSKISISALKTVVAIAQTKDFTKAATILNKVPTAVSYTLNNLEQNLNIKLFERKNKKLEPTAAGRYLIAKADLLLDDLSECELTLKRISQNFEDKLVIAVNNIININPILDILKQSQNRFPLTQIEIRQEVHNGVWDSLITNRAQIAVGAPNEQLLGINIQSFKLGEIKWFFCVSPDCELRKFPKPLTNDILRRFPAVCIKDTAKMLEKKNAWLLDGQSCIFVPNFKDKIQAQIRNIGVGFIPSFMAQPHINRGELVSLEVKDKKHDTSLSVAWNISDNHGPCASFWLESLKKPTLFAKLTSVN